MPAQPLRCEVSVIPEDDYTGENAVECGAIALACVDCGESAGCEEHAVICSDAESRFTRSEKCLRRLRQRCGRGVVSIFPNESNHNQQ